MNYLYYVVCMTTRFCCSCVWIDSICRNLFKQIKVLPFAESIEVSSLKCQKCIDDRNVALFFHFRHSQRLFGCFLKWWYAQNTPKWSFLVGQPIVVGYHHFRKPPFVTKMLPFFFQYLQANIFHSRWPHPYDPYKWSEINHLYIMASKTWITGVISPYL